MRPRLRSLVQTVHVFLTDVFSLAANWVDVLLLYALCFNGVPPGTLEVPALHFPHADPYQTPIAPSDSYQKRNRPRSDLHCSSTTRPDPYGTPTNFYVPLGPIPWFIPWVGLVGEALEGTRTRFW
jgi:hypothetical protein